MIVPFLVIVCEMLALAAFPMLMGLMARDRKATGPLAIRHDNAKDARYFAKSFTALMERALADYDATGTIHLSKPEALLTVSTDLPVTQGHDAIIYAGETNLFTGPGSVFVKEIYAKYNARIGAGSQIRAIACSADLTILEGVVVERWADAVGTLTAKSGSDLGISASSASRLAVDTGCRFRRLYAPVITVGWPSEGQAEDLDERLRPTEPRYTELLRDIQSVADGQSVSQSIVTRHGLVLGEGSCVYGSVKGLRDVYVKAGGVVTGDILAEGDVILSEHAQVNGNVFAQGSIRIGPDVRLGQYGKIKSCVARGGISIGERVIIHGFVGSEEGGVTVSAARP